MSIRVNVTGPATVDHVTADQKAANGRTILQEGEYETFIVKEGLELRIREGVPVKDEGADLPASQR